MIDLDTSFAETFGIGSEYNDYWTLVLPPRPYPTLACMSEWYARHEILSRGCFKSELEAHLWAHKNLYGPYSVRFVEMPDADEEDERDRPRWQDTSVQPDKWPRARLEAVRTIRLSPDDECYFHSNGGNGACGYCEDGQGDD